MIEKITPVIENSNIEIILGLGIAIIILFILLFITMVNLSLFRAKYKKLNKSSKGFSYDDHIINNKKDIEFIKKIQSDTLGQLDVLKEGLKLSYSKVNLYRYNAFEQQGGQLSFILIMLNGQNDGVILHNVHNNDFTYMYGKSVTNGETEEVLTKEEKDQLTKIINKNK